ncbi:MAG: DNA polymerase [Phycisphaerales bacterium]|jgi:DNA polymerase
MATTVVNLNTSPYDTYIGRPKAGAAWGFGNPFPVAQGGRRVCIDRFARWLAGTDYPDCPDATPERRAWILEHLEELRGKRLGCFCAPKECHGEVLLKLLKPKAKSIYHLDYESTSACDIKLGGYRYSSDPTTRILMFAIAKDDGDPHLWSFIDPESPESKAAMALLREALDSGSPIFAHNASFELAMSTYRMKPDLGLDPPDINNWRCTQAMCRRAAAPESLAKAAAFFGLGDQKDPIGKALIGVFSDQNKSVLLEPPPGAKGEEKLANRRSANPIMENPVPWGWTVKVSGEKMTVRRAWDMFCEYNRQDVRVERELHHKIKHFELKGDVLESFLFDLRMNFRGVPVNVHALKNAKGIVDHLTEKLSRKFTEVTGIKPSQRARALAWMRERGYPADNMQSATVDEILAAPPAGMTAEAIEALRAYSLVGFAALAKIPAMINCACADGYVRGTTQWHGARTGRASGRLVQPQNLRRPTIKETDLCYDMICYGQEPQWFEDLWESPLEAIASSIRHFFQPHEGMAISSDFSTIEGRLAAHVTGDLRTLQMMLDGVDLYKDLGSSIFKVGYDAVTKDQRQASKVTWLACIYGAGGRTLKEAFAKVFRVSKTLEECKGYADVYRETHPEIVNAWAELDAAAKKAIGAPGTKVPVLKGRIEFQCGRVASIDYLTLRLPSGRRLYYPFPQVKWEWVAYTEEEMAEEPWKREKKGYRSERVSYFGQRQGAANWGRITVFPAKWLENLVQAMGVDFLNHGCIACDRAGIDIRMIIHDEIFGLHDGRPIEEVNAIFCTRPTWAQDFALEAQSELVAYYRK